MSSLCFLMFIRLHKPLCVAGLMNMSKSFHSLFTLCGGFGFEHKLEEQLWRCCIHRSFKGDFTSLLKEAWNQCRSAKTRLIYWNRFGLALESWAAVVCMSSGVQVDESGCPHITSSNCVRLNLNTKWAVVLPVTVYQRWRSLGWRREVITAISYGEF